MIDPMTSLAFSVYSGRGVHALLLGSGISRSSGIPTGWEIVLDLIRRVAAVEGEQCEKDPAAWYLERYGKEPAYTEILEATAKTSTERMQILRSYFEPNDDDREAGRKQPTPAHHAIAKLVADGYIRVIVTTNFDRLIEIAVQAAGVVPSVIASTDSIRGTAPLAQSKCTIIKVHGDYLDSRLKNTPDEVGEYDEAMNRLLDQVFDEYGLIVCGWSADWDAALRAAIERCPNRRYTTYWSAFGELTDVAERLCQKRAAQVVKGMGADEFFMKLSEKVAALEDMSASHPLSARLAVATLKRYLSEDKYRIRLHDFVMEEAGKAATVAFSDLGMEPSLKEYEGPVETLLHLLAAGGYWGRANHRRLWLRCFLRLVTPRSGPLPGLNGLHFYPAYLALYSYGIGAMAGKRQGNLAYVLAKGSVRIADNGERPLVNLLIQTLRNGSLDKFVKQADKSFVSSSVPTSKYLLTRLREPLREWIPEDSRYEELFCRFEYIVALASWGSFQRIDDRSKRITDAVPGLYMSRRELPEQVQAEIERCKQSWPYLRAGLFDGNLDRLKETKAALDQAVSRK